MQTIKLKLAGETILTLPAGEHEAIQESGKVYLLYADLGAGTAAPAKAAPAAAKEPEVVDDKAPKATRAPRTTTPKAEAPAPAAAPATPPARASRKPATPPPPPPPAEESADELIEIPAEEWGNIQAGELAIAKINIEGQDPEKEWEVQIVGFKKARGAAQEEFYVKFLEDNQEDFLREGDRLFEYAVQE